MAGEVEGAAATFVVYRGAKMLGERALIERIRASARGRNPAVRVGIGDDCAVLRVPAGCEMVVTTDLCLEGRHFRRDWHSPESAGHRCLARGLSDVAAMGGRPLAAFLSLALPRGYELAWVDGFMAGFGALAERFGVELAGGDLGEAAGAEIVADVMVVGAVPEGKALLRSGAGWDIFVTGTLGGAAVELEEMKAGAARRVPGVDLCPQSFPEPRLDVGRELMRRTVETRHLKKHLGFSFSCMDLSDGLSTDLRHMCEASGCGAEIWEAALPIAPGATLEQALHGGEDYELLFTAHEWREQAPTEIAGVKITKIGTIGDKETGVRLLRKDGRLEALEAGGWEHLKA